MINYYLHQIDAPQGGIVIIDNEPVTKDTTTYINGYPIVYGDGTPVKSKIGWTLGPCTTRNEAEVLALAISERYNWDVMIDGVLLRLPIDDNRKRAASLLRSIPSEDRTAASRENGKKGGRPRKTPAN